MPSTDRYSLASGKSTAATTTLFQLLIEHMNKNPVTELVALQTALVRIEMA